MLSNFHEILFFTGFLVVIGLMLAIDLGVFDKKSHDLKFREALTWTIVWVALSLTFFFLLRYFGNELHNLQDKAEVQQKVMQFKHPIKITPEMSSEEAINIYNKNLSMEYITGYLIEYSLSVDNIFVMIMIFLSFGIKTKYYKRVLLWGILGAIVMRFIFIFSASALIQRFEWILYLFGLLLIFVGFHMGYEFYQETVKHKAHKKKDPHDHWLVKVLSRMFRVTREDHGDRFFLMHEKQFYITPLFIVMVLIEFSDVVFAVDSVPAVFSVTRDPFIVFFSNIFAILGLRSLFFLVINFMGLRFLKASLGVLLVFVGFKMISEMFWPLPFTVSQNLLILGSILAAGVILSFLFPGKKQPPAVNIQ